ncbi:MAG: hypothetical protein ACPL7B_00015 [Candidatus Poribacteria bacterium]
MRQVLCYERCQRIFIHFTKIKIESKVYQSQKLDIHEKADILTATAIFAGMKDKNLAMEFIKRRRDIMIESPVYEYIKEEIWGEALEKGREEGLHKGLQEGLHKGLQEGKREGLQEAIALGLEIKFGVESLKLMDKVNKIKSITKLERVKETIRKANSIDEVKNILK